MHYPIKKLAETIEMSFDIPPEEKKIAEEAKEYFEDTSHLLGLAVQHLSVIYDPFTKHTDVPVDSVVKHRGLLARLANKIKENFEEIQRVAVMAIQKLDHFSTGDSEIQELINSFVETIDSLSENVSELLELLSRNYRIQDFRDKIIKSIDQIKENAREMEKLVYDRIIDHIDTNIIAKDWVHDIGDKLNLDMEEHVPAILRLFDERQKQLNPEQFPDSNKNQQILNPGDAQKIYYPDAIRYMPGSLGGGKE